MASFWGCCFGRGRVGGGDDAAAAAAVTQPASVSAGQSPPAPDKDGALATAGVVMDVAPVFLPSHSAAGVVANGDAERGTSPRTLVGSARTSSAADSPASGSADGERPRPSAAAGGHAGAGGDAASPTGAAGTAAQGHTGGDDPASGDRGGDSAPGHTGCGDGDGSGGTDAVRGRGYPIVTFQVRSCTSDMRAVASGTHVHACLGRNVYVLWRTPWRGVPASEDDFRRAGPSSIRLERGGVGALRVATADEAAAADVPHTDRLLLLQGTDVSSAGAAQAPSVVTLLLEAPSSTESVAWAAAGLSLLTPLEELLAVDPDRDGGTAHVQELVQAVLPPLPAATSGQPNVVSRMLGRRGRRFVLNAHHWLTPATPGVLPGASVIRKVGDVADGYAPAPFVGPALRLGLLVVQVGALAVLAGGQDARREDAVGRCEGVACDLLDRVFTELQGGATEFGGAYVKQLCLLMGHVEEVLEDIEGTFFTTPIKAALASGIMDRWEQQMKEISKVQTTLGVPIAIGHTVDRVETGLDRLQKKVSTIGRRLRPRSAETPDLSDCEVRWRPPALGGNYVTGVDRLGRAEHTIVATLQRWAVGGRAEAPRVGVCAIGGSGKSTACAGVAVCKQARTLFPRGTTWVQLNESSSTETLSTAAVALVYRFCGADEARHLLQHVQCDDFWAVAAGYLRTAVVVDASKFLVIIDDVLDRQAGLLEQLLLVVPSGAPVLFTTRSAAVVASVAGAERVTIDSLPEEDARELLAKSINSKPGVDERVFSETEELEFVRPVLERSERHALSLGIVADLIKARCGRWRPVMEALEHKWMDASSVRPLNELDPRRSVRETLDVSRALLLDDASRSAFEAVGILPANELIGTHVLERLWRPQLGDTGAVARSSSSSVPQIPNPGRRAVHPGVDRLVDTLVRAGLLHHEVENGNLAGVVIHPVVCGYARSLLGDETRATHERLVNEYARECAAVATADDEWYAYKFWLTPDDGYWYDHVAGHAAACGNLPALVSLMADAWMDARQRSGSGLGHQADVELVMASLRAVVDDVRHEIRATPVLLGAVHWGLAAACVNRVRGSRAGIMEEAAALLQRGLCLVPQAEAPGQWAEMQNDLASAHVDRMTGDKAVNMEKALSCYQRALQVRTQDASPQGWAETQQNLASLYLQRVDGDKAANIEVALACCQRALEIRTRTALPLAWARAQDLLGEVYLQRVVGDQAVNQQEALACFCRALEARTRQAVPLAWAESQCSLGDTYARLVVGDKSANVEQALAHYRLALEVWTRTAAPLDWAQSQYALSLAYMQRVVGDRADNIESALACCRRALEAHTQLSAPLEWAEGQHLLGFMYVERVVGDMSANVEEALACYNRALEVRTPQAEPLEWAATQHNMGYAYASRSVGVRAANVEEALACYRRALEVRTREAAPQEWAVTQHLMGCAYSIRSVGDRAANVEEALACYRRALEVRTREAAPQDWAVTQRLMGDAYSRRVLGDESDNLQEALACRRRARAVRTGQITP